MAPPLIVTPFAASGDQSVVPATDPNGFVNYLTGYTPDYEINLTAGDPQAKAVERGIQNYLFNALTGGMQAWQVSNRPPWYNNMPGGYAQWAEVVFPNGSGVPVPYRSLVSGNTATPGSSVNWEYIQGSGEMIKNIPMPSGGPNGPGSLLVTAATDFNTFTASGTFQFQSDAVVTGSPHTPSNGGNAAAAGMLEVTTWLNAGATYVTQFFRDRNGLAFMRGATNGSWTAWKIWANAQQFVVGEVRMWSGTATEAAVQAAWGPGWHFCNGANGTPDLRNRFIAGAGSTYALGSSGGATSYAIAVGNLPAHNHVVNISDPTHTHGINQAPHGHSISDPGHAHAVSDPGHGHTAPGGNFVVIGGAGGNGLGGGGQAFSFQGTTNNAGTGIGIFSNGTGVSVVAQNANISNFAASTGITATTNNTGSGTALSITPPYYALSYVMYTGA
jgi:hypothetical protein